MEKTVKTVETAKAVRARSTEIVLYKDEYFWTKEELDTLRNESNKWLLDNEEGYDSLLKHYPCYAKERLNEVVDNELLNNYGDERLNLDIATDTEIIAFASLGLASGRRMGYKSVGHNIQNCLCTECDAGKLYIDIYGDLRGEFVHHDGANYVLYRAVKKNITEKKLDALFYTAKNGATLFSKDEVIKTFRDITRKLGNDIMLKYGQKIAWVKKARGHSAVDKKTRIA